MKLGVLTIITILWLGFPGGSVVAQQQHGHNAPPPAQAAADKIGQVSFPISCAPAAEKPFERAVALLHAFWYLEAVKGFTEHNITPGPIATARELLGDMLLEMGQPAQAAREYEASLNRAPNRFKTLYGIARASELGGDRDRARTYYTRLVAVASGSDNQRPELQQAKAFLGKN